MNDFLEIVSGSQIDINYESLTVQEASEKIKEIKPKYEDLLSNPCARKKYKEFRPFGWKDDMK